MNRLDVVIDQLKATRAYTENLLARIEERDWFRRPSEGVTHVAWQVGHLAVADYSLLLERIRGARPEDTDLIAREFRARFRRGSVPDPDPSGCPPTLEFRAVFDRVRAQAMDELAVLGQEELDQPTSAPHPWFNTKLGALTWCTRHEMLHAGQIGLLRRLFGAEPLW